MVGTEVLELAALLNSPLKREPAKLTTLESFSYMVYFSLLRFVSKRDG